VEPGLGIVRRSVIDNDQLKVPVRLLKDVINGLRDYPGSIVSWDYNADQWIVFHDRKGEASENIRRKKGSAQASGKRGISDWAQATLNY